jgi:hypothetical protein
MFSGLPPIATDARIFWIGSVVPQADEARPSIHEPAL